jgi:putative monooxygenase
VLRPVEGFQVTMLATGQFGAQGLTTCIAHAGPRARLPYHTHPTGEAITLLEGEAYTYVEGRRYRMRALDAIFVPAGVAHSIENARDSGDAILHTSFPTEQVTREFREDIFPVQDCEATSDEVPEKLVRFETAEKYSLAEGVVMWDLFAGRFGARGVCGGYGVFQPGCGLPCHYHDFDESITIIDGRAECQVAGARYELDNLATACIPRERPHRFLNHGPREMTMLWVYAANEPDRVLVATGYCDGTLKYDE